MRFPLAMAGLLTLLVSGSAPGGALPQSDRVFTSTRSIAALKILGNEVWAATRGGVIRIDAVGRREQWTTEHGLPSHEVLGLQATPLGMVAVTPLGRARYSGFYWQILPPGTTSSPRILEATWQGRKWRVEGRRLVVEQSGGWREVALPSGGTHVTGLASGSQGLLIALYNGGLWRLEGSRWQPVLPALPTSAREITALAADGDRVWIGTRRAGLWQRSPGGWIAHQLADEPADHNIQSLCEYEERLWAGTLEDGLIAYDGRRWAQIAPPEISTAAPRQMVVFRDDLFLRHGNGALDRRHAGSWVRAWGELPRKQCSALAADSHRLYVAQWGGWSEWDGRSWQHFLRLPELQGLPITCILPVGDDLWIGTQGRGLAYYRRRQARLDWFDERHGLPDDWITCLAERDGVVYAGTFVGGVATGDGTNWRSSLIGEHVTAIVASRDRVDIVTRSGAWSLSSAAAVPLPWRESVERENQALLSTPRGYWVGARTGLRFVRRD